MTTTPLFSIESETIDISGMDAMCQFAHYDPYAPELFLDDLKLSRDLTNKFGTVLYSQGTRLTPKHLSRLLELQESNASIDFDFSISRSAKLIQGFREEIKEQFTSLVSHRTKNAALSKIIDEVSGSMDKFLDELLVEENFTLMLYQMRFICSNSKKTKSVKFKEHPVNVSLISLAIATSDIFLPEIGGSKKKLLDVCKAAIFHNYGALTDIDTILEKPDEIREKSYWIANRDAIANLKTANLGKDVSAALYLVCDYQFDKRDFLSSYDWSSIVANIIIVSEMFLNRESGLFSDSVPLRKVVDQLNVRVAENNLAFKPVRALTLGLDLLELFDFYKELKSLTDTCPFKSAVPYPLVGFKSPTIFVCKKDVRKCKFIEASLKAINLVHDMGELKQGSYRRCWLLTPHLISFYKTHYRAIKSIRNTALKEN